MIRAGQPDSIWPIAIYPTGWMEFVFQNLAVRAPFDDVRVRDGLRHKLHLGSEGMAVAHDSFKTNPVSLRKLLERCQSGELELP